MKTQKKLVSILLTFMLLISLMPTALAAESSYQDTNEHWAEAAIERWSGYGIVQGADGMFDPNGQLTCAQLATILVNLLKLPAAPSAGFTDNPDGSWFADAINRCAAAGILLGNGDGTVAPTQSISRDRTMVMLARALGVEPVANPDLSNYSDAAKVAPYAAGYVAALVDAGIVNGLTETELAPQEEINRASTVTILDKAISTYADKDGATVNVTDGKGITLIVADNVTVKGTVETLVVASSDANVKLDGVTAEKVAVTGEGNKVELANSKVETVVASGEKAAVATSGKTTVETVSIAAADASMSVGKGSTVETLTVTEAAANAEVKVASGASVQALETAAEKTTVDNSGVIATATIAESATGTEVKANSGSYTGTVKTEAADTTVGGTGAVAKVEASGSAASGDGAANVTTQGTTTEKTDASGATSTDTNTGKLPATDSANSEAAKDAAAGTGNDTPTTAPSGGSGGDIPNVPSHSHTFSEEWSKDESYHWHAATCEHTSEMANKAAHSGGTATCKERAVCEVCDQAYGELAHDYVDDICTVCGAINENVKFYLGVASGSTVDAIVTDDYKAVFRLPAVDSTVSTASVTLTAKMQNVGSLGVSGLREHKVTLNPGLGSHDVVLSSWLDSCYAFSGATINATIDDNACTYTIAGISENKIVATTDTMAARAAWQALASHVVTSAQPTDDSKIVIKKGSWMKICNEHLHFEDNADDLILNNFSNLTALQQTIRDAVRLDTCEDQDATITLFMKAGTQLAVGQSIATLKDDCTIRVTVHEETLWAVFEGKLAALRAQNNNYMLAQELINLFDSAVYVIDTSGAVDVSITFAESA